MIYDPRPSLRTRLRAYLGHDDITHRLNTMEEHMAKAAEQLTELKNAFTDFSSDVNAKLDQLVAAQGDLNPEAQGIFDEIKQAVADADAKVGDADGSDVPTGPVVEPDADGDVIPDETGRNNL